MPSEEVLTPVHPRWNEFVDALSRSLICIRTTDNARRVLTGIRGIDVDGSLEALRRLGGRCDCEIVFDVAGVEERAL